MKSLNQVVLILLQTIDQAYRLKPTFARVLVSVVLIVALCAPSQSLYVLALHAGQKD